MQADIILTYFVQQYEICECIFVSLTQSGVLLGAYSIAAKKIKPCTYQLNEASFRFNFKSKNINRLGELSYLISFPSTQFRITFNK